MTAYQPTKPNRPGFTLVELLIAMTVIAILAGLVTVAAARVLNTTREFAIKSEMTQLEQALEQFEIEYGFYPPSFRDIDAAADLLPFLNRIAPNHGEGNGSDGLGLETWWDDTGQHLFGSANHSPEVPDPNLRPGSDLVFWLSGLSKNRQFPLSGGGERQVFFEFASDRLNFSNDPAIVDVASYAQPGRRPSPYLYRDAGTYLPTAGNNDGAYTFPGTTADNLMDAETMPDVFNAIFPNPNTFQLITAGLDGDWFAGDGAAAQPGPQNQIRYSGAAENPQANNPPIIDNIANFGPEGPSRLDVISVAN